MDNPDPYHLFDPLDHKPTVSVKQLAEALDKHPETVRRGLLDGTIKGGFRTKAGGHWRIRKKLFLAWYKEQMERLTNG